MRAAVVVVLTVALLAVSARPQDLAPKAAPQDRAMAFVNATIHPVSGETIEGGYVHLEGGIIRDVGKKAPDFHESVLVVDVGGKHLWPGLVGAHTTIGLTEIGAVRATRDFDEVGAVTPEVRAAVAVNPDSTLVPVTRSSGVLTVGTFPRGGAIPGRASVIRLTGWTYEDMTVLDDAGVVVAWPSMRPVRAWWMEKSKEQQQEEARKNLARIEEAFARSKAYHDARLAGAKLPFDIRWEAMRHSFGFGEKKPARPVFFLAQEYDQIVGSVDFAARHGLRPIIVGGRDARLCLGLLAEHRAGVVLTGTFGLPRRSDSDYDESFRLPAALEKAGIEWCLASGQPAWNERNLPYAAAMAVAHGLPREAAIRAITLRAAQLLGVGDRLGSIEKGKAATLILTDGDPLEMTCRIETALIDGRQIDLGNKQTALAAKYREKYRQIGLLPEK